MRYKNQMLAVFFTAGALACLVGVCLGLFIRAGGGAFFLNPLLVMFSSDKVIDPGTLRLVENALVTNVPILAIISLLCALYIYARQMIVGEPQTVDYLTTSQPFVLKEVLVILLIVCVALLLRLPSMDRGFFFDELFLVTHYLEGGSFGDIFHKFTLTDHIGYTVFAFLSTKLFGLSEWSLRLPALLFGIGGIVVFWFLARKIFGSGAALLSSLWLAVAPAHILWSVSGRGYSGYVLCTSILVLLYFNLLRQQTALQKTGFIVAAILGASFHIYCVLFVMGCLLHLLWIVYIDSQKRFYSNAGILAAWEAIGISFFLMIVIFLPLTARTWIELAMRKSHELSVFFPLSLVTYLLSSPAWPFLVLSIGVLLLSFYKKRKNGTGFSLFMGLMFFLVVLVWLCRPYFLYERFWAGLLPFIFLLICQGLFQVKNWSRMGKIFAGSFVLVFSILPVFSFFSGQSVALSEFSGTFKEAVKLTESRLPLSSPIYATGLGRDLFKFYATRPIQFFHSVDEYYALRKTAVHGACLVFNDHRIADRWDDLILENLRRTSHEQKVGNISIFFFD